MDGRGDVKIYFVPFWGYGWGLEKICCVKSINVLFNINNQEIGWLGVVRKGSC